MIQGLSLISSGMVGGGDMKKDPLEWRKNWKEGPPGARRRQTLEGFGRLIVKNYQRVEDCCGFMGDHCEECNRSWNLLCWAAISYACISNFLPFPSKLINNVQVTRSLETFTVRFFTKDKLYGDLLFNEETIEYFLNSHSP